MSAANDSYDPKQVAALAPENLQDAVEQARKEFSAAADLPALAAVKPAHLGDKAPLMLARREIGALPPKAKSDAGKRVNEAQKAVREAFDERRAELEAERDERVLREERVDVTLPWDAASRGARHPVTTTAERIVDVFVAMGYEVAEGPELEAEWFNFDALNYRADLPERTTQAVFRAAPADSGLVLRTHTSPVQMRALLERDLPVYVVAPGRAFRPEEAGAHHAPVFHQVEGLAVDKGLTMAHLKGTLATLSHAMFGDGVKIRTRPAFFPFTEPSAEIDVWFEEKADGPGWVKWGGCGMVGPDVLATAGIDPGVHSGFAFGVGVERTLQLRNGIPDMRDMVEGDVRFTRPFGVEAF
jgi:phenylalanyl-tRNA synthetase alpha chain